LPQNLVLALQLPLLATEAIVPQPEVALDLRLCLATALVQPRFPLELGRGLVSLLRFSPNQVVLYTIRALNLAREPLKLLL
jgi:hypothetical protein